MRKIDFTKLNVPKGINGIREKSYYEANVAKSFADLLFDNTGGVANSRLAEKIYDSNGPIELNDEEEMLLLQFTNSCQILFNPIRVAIEYNLKENDKKKK